MFTGTIAVQLATGDVIDLADITAGANATVRYSGHNSHGTLTVSDRTHAAISLLRNYLASIFTTFGDGQGEPPVSDPQC
jgi:large repetitive protein